MRKHKLLEESMGGRLLAIGLWQCVFFFFFGFDTESKGHKSKSKQGGLHQKKAILETIKNMKRELDWEKTFASHI